MRSSRAFFVLLCTSLYGSALEPCSDSERPLLLPVRLWQDDPVSGTDKILEIAEAFNEERFLMYFQQVFRVDMLINFLEVLEDVYLLFSNVGSGIPHPRLVKQTITKNSVTVSNDACPCAARRDGWHSCLAHRRRDKRSITSQGDRKPHVLVFGLRPAAAPQTTLQRSNI